MQYLYANYCKFVLTVFNAILARSSSPTKEDMKENTKRMLMQQHPIVKPLVTVAAGPWPATFSDLESFTVLLGS